MKKELPRQTLHVVLGLVFLGLLYILPFNQAAAGIALIAGLGFLLSFLIKVRWVKNKQLEYIIGVVQRGEKVNITGEPALWFAIGCLVALALVPEPSIALGAVAVLTFGDAAATIVGKKFGRTQLKEKRTLEGSIAGIIVGTLVLLPFFPLEAAIPAAFLGMLAEYLPIDDNVGIPVVVALVLAFFL
jgi:dolichol kinase